jgi:hypothetical protein
MAKKQQLKLMIVFLWADKSLTALQIGHMPRSREAGKAT